MPADSPQDEPSPWLGHVIDNRYRLVEVIGTGAMGAVYRAEHVTTRRKFAVKLLHADYATNLEFRERFEREAIAIGRIKHPNCVDVSDFAALDDGSLYLAMEFLEGESLADVVDRGEPLDPVRALRIARHLIRGLGHAHSAGIVHRDVKPDNVFLIQRDGDPDFAKLLDFGIAKVMGEGDAAGTNKLTRAGMAFGTPLYISPEQATGGKVDGRADLYSATVLLFEMLAGQPPFDADDNRELLSKHATVPPPTLAEVAPEAAVTPEIEALVARGLAKRKAERFADAAEYEAAITAILVAMGAEPVATGHSIRAGRGATVPVVYSQSAAATPTTPPPAVDDDPAAVAIADEPLPATATQQVSLSRRTLVLGAAVVALAGGLAAFLLLRGGGDDTLSLSEVRTLAERLIEEDKPEAAVALLESHGELVADSAEGQIALGSARVAAGKSADALASFQLAVELDGEAAHDPNLRAGLRDLMADKNKKLAKAAATYAISEAAVEGAADDLVELASGHESYRIRKRAQAMAADLGLADKVDQVRALSLDLGHRSAGYHCRHRKRALAKLRKLGDPRAIPAIREAMERVDSKGKPVNDCLIKQARAALLELEAAK